MKKMKKIDFISTRSLNNIYILFNMYQLSLLNISLIYYIKTYDLRLYKLVANLSTEI